MGAKIFDNFVKRGGPMSLACFSDGDRAEIRAPLDASSLPMAEARKVFDDAQKKAVKAIEDHCYAGALLTRHPPFWPRDSQAPACHATLHPLPR